MPKVSVIIPVYGVEKYIERCARSLFEQTLDDIEYLFIDDCTPDKSIEVLNRVLEEYPQRKNQVIIHRLEKNSGQAAVRKWGMLNATGDYTIHCDSDDWVDVTMYEKMYNKAIEEDADVVVCDFLQSDGNEYRVMVSSTKSVDVKSMLINGLMHRYSSSLWNKMVRRTVYTESEIIYPKYAMAEDLTLFSQILFNSKRVAYIPEPLYFYYYNNESISRKEGEDQIVKRFDESIGNLSLIYEKFSNKNIDSQIRIAFFYAILVSKERLLPLLKESKYYKIWSMTYPEITQPLLLSKMVSLKSKLRIILVKMRLYPYFRELMDIVKG